MKNLEKLYNEQRYNEIIEINKINVNTKDCEKFYLYAGFSYLKMGYPQEAISCLNKVKSSEFSRYRGKIYRYLALADYLLSDYNNAQYSFILGEKNGDRESALWNELLFPLCSEKIETKFIIFRFVDVCDSINKKLFVLKNVKAFLRINEYIGGFRSKKKIDIYVYTHRVDSIGNALSYADNGLKVIHTYIDDVVGHEIAHILFNSMYNKINKNAFIDEGIATFFNEELPFSQFIEKYKSYISNADIIELWQRNILNKEDYYLAGAFIGYLIKVYGKNDFLEFVRNESFENAMVIFGSSLEKTINEFYKLVN